jgi:O-antigen ligase
MSVPSRAFQGMRRWAGLLDRAGALLLIAVAGFVLGQQYVAPNKRVIPVIMAIVLFGLAWRADMPTAIGLLLLALPYPRYTTFGSTNLAFVLLLLVIWLLRTTMGQASPPRRTPVDVPLVAVLLTYVLSFYNVEPAQLGANLQVFVVTLACWLMFYVITNNLRTPGDFQRVFVFQAISAFTICLVALYEVTHPGTTVVQMLFKSSQALTAGQSSLTDLRVGSAFLDYELLCEYCALNLLLVLFLFMRARSLLPRLAYGGLLLFLTFVLFTTVTRGGFIALAVGLLYLAWQVRRRLTFVGVTVTLAAIVVGAFVMNAYVATSTQSGNLFERLFTSQVKGLVPDTRSVVWPMAWERIFEHPLLGHGPRWELLSGNVMYHWPHSLYLFVANNAGFLGLAAMLWLLWTLFRITRPVNDDLRSPDALGSYLLVARAQMVIFLVDQIKVEYMRNMVYEFQVWVMFALMVAASQAVRRREAAPGTRTRAAGRLP